MDNKIRVVVADKYELFREGLRLLIKKAKDFDCIGVATDINEASKLVQELAPDITLLDTYLLGKESVEANQYIGALRDFTKIMILTHSESDTDILHCLQAGVKGYLLKDIGQEQLMTAMRAVYAGEQVLCPVVVTKISAILQKEQVQQVQREHSVPCPLKKRELEVVGLAAEGTTNKVIASKLHITEHTVASHLVNVFRKLGVGSRTEAVLRCVEHRWLAPKHINQ